MVNRSTAWSSTGCWVTTALLSQDRARRAWRRRLRPAPNRATATQASAPGSGRTPSAARVDATIENAPPSGRPSSLAMSMRTASTPERCRLGSTADLAAVVGVPANREEPGGLPRRATLQVHHGGLQVEPPVQGGATVDDAHRHVEAGDLVAAEPETLGPQVMRPGAVATPGRIARGQAAGSQRQAGVRGGQAGRRPGHRNGHRNGRGHRRRARRIGSRAGRVPDPTLDLRREARSGMGRERTPSRTGRWGVDVNARARGGLLHQQQPRGLLRAVALVADRRAIRPPLGDRQPAAAPPRLPPARRTTTPQPASDHCLPTVRSPALPGPAVTMAA